MVDAAERLNTMRNRLAHHLDDPQIEAQVRDFVSSRKEEPDDPETEAVPLVHRLGKAIAMLCYEFNGVAELMIRAK
jgi:hypothetical protein